MVIARIIPEELWIRLDKARAARDSDPHVAEARIQVPLAIIGEEWPDPETLETAGLSHPAQLLGFYHGIPLTARTHDYGMVLPDKISIYRQPLLRYYRTPGELREGIRHTVLHELAHYFGLSDERLRELGAY